ncbi:Shikimate dehydrogenase [Marinomonas aquimarina]|uniref:Shikimate dehydrogenase (NADP(+)) n=1 Tax=Marinomonas aquimarina TaxID=295068 RepID=A0A1A8T8G6_9GAMM|nr:shikimate dehydrogenase [Marinomonas aquimarina]SBS28971.1 Shikimate dehydrogenase [Marinomonas aquimarina]
MEQFAVIGNPIAHSRSPEIHHAFGQQTGRDVNYEKILGDLEGFEQQVRDFFAAGGKGLNVTVPFKQRAYDMCDKLSKRAQEAGAVNTLIMGKNGELYGDNTDGTGMVRDIVEVLGQPLEGKRVLLIGAGGAVRGVIGPILARHPASLTIANRTVSRAQELAEVFGCDYAGFDELEGPFDVIINGSSASLGGDLPPLKDELVGENTWVYDMVYGKEPTVFMQWAFTHGAKGSDGLGMLVGQAAEAFFLWQHVRPQQAPVIEQLRSEM